VKHELIPNLRFRIPTSFYHSGLHPPTFSAIPSTVTSTNSIEVGLRPVLWL
jgi:hypothetical protein